VGALGRLDLALVPSDLPDRDRVRQSVLDGADAILSLQRAQPWGQAYNPDRWVWGSNSQVLNNQVVLAAAYDISGDAEYLDAVIESMDYLLGRNGVSISFVTGYGTNYSRNQHNRWYAHALDPAMPEPPPGSIAGGPNSDHSDGPSQTWLTGCVRQLCYIDHIDSYSTNEVAINWNAALAWVTAFLADTAEGGA
jgi:endoglucanase